MKNNLKIKINTIAGKRSIKLLLNTATDFTQSLHSLNQHVLLPQPLSAYDKHVNVLKPTKIDRFYQKLSNTHGDNSITLSNKILLLNMHIVNRECTKSLVYYLQDFNLIF